MLFEIERRRDRALSGARAIDELRERAVAIGADDDAHVLRLGEQLRAEPLRHAAGHTDHRPRLHVPPQLAEAPDHALLGVLANRARVHEDDVRPIRVIDRVVTVRRQLPEHQLGIAHVHLAAVRLDVDCGARVGHGLGNLLGLTAGRPEPRNRNLRFGRRFGVQNVTPHRQLRGETIAAHK